MSIAVESNVEVKQTSESKKFLHHFESINTPVKFSPVLTSGTSKNKYANSIEMYASSVSFIDKIANSPIKESSVHVAGDKKKFVGIPMIVSLNPKIKEKILGINKFFNPTKGENYRFDSRHEQGNFNNYIENILSIDMKNVLPREESEQNYFNARSKSKGRHQEVEINKESPEQHVSLQQKAKEMSVTEELNVSVDKNSKPNKIKLLYAEIMHEKRRKGFVPDYLRSIQMKLVEFFDYIMHDDAEYFGMSLSDKMKKVLTNIECLKGKKIDGESKIEMLRVFFCEFRDLKNESRKIEEETRKREKFKEESKFRENKPIKNEFSSPLSSKNKKNSDTFSMGGGKTGKKNSRKNEYMKEEEQWMGSL